MSLRIVDRQFLQTNPNLLLSGASKASASFWIAVNPDHGVADEAGITIFGEVGGDFSATLLGTGGLRLRWASHDRGADLFSTCLMNLAPGVSHHVAATWEPGSQQYYLDGVLVQADACSGLLGASGEATPRPIRLGSDQVGADVSLDSPIVWVGHALAASEVLDLGDRAARPGGIAPLLVALQWSLAGPAGVEAKVGDPGLADASSSGLHLSEIVGSPPTYEAALSKAILFQGGPGVSFAAATAPSGKSIVLTFQDSSGQPSNITSIRSSNEVQSISLAALPSGNAFALAFGGQATPPIPAQSLPPVHHVSYLVSGLTPGAAYSLATTWRCFGASVQSADVLYRVFDGNTQDLAALLGSSHQNQTTNPSGTAYADGSGVSYNFNPLGSYTPTGATLTVQLSSNSDQNYIVGALRIQAPSNVVTYLLPGDPAFSAHDDPSVTTGYPGAFGGSIMGDNSSGTDYRLTATGGAAAIQAALTSLSTIRTGNVTVAATAGTGGNAAYSVTFVGPFANQPQALITCPDPAVQVARTYAGGSGSPALKVNGSVVAGLVDWLWPETNHSIPTAMCPLHQAAPAARTIRLLADVYAGVGNWQQNTDPSCLSGIRLSTPGSDFSASYPLQALPPGTYRFAITYPVVAGASAASRWKVLDAAGNLLFSGTFDQTQAPADYTALGKGFKYLGPTLSADRFNDGFTLVLLPPSAFDHDLVIDAVQFLRTSADDSIVIAPGDVVTITTSDGWATTAAGPVPGVVAQPVAPPSATSIIPAPSGTPKAMAIGYNINGESEVSQLPLFTNLAVRFQAIGAVAANSDGYPTRINGTSYSYPLALQPSAVGGTSKGYNSVPGGRYTLTWTGNSDVELIAPGDIIAPVSSSDHKKVYDIRATAGVHYSPTIYVVIHATAVDPSDSSGIIHLADVGNLSVVLPDPSDPSGNTAWVNPPKFYPPTLDKMGAIRSLRFLDWSGVNMGGYTHFSEIKQQSHVNRSALNVNRSIPVASIRAPTGARFFSAGTLTTTFPVEVEVTTAVPHGLDDFTLVDPEGCGVATFDHFASSSIDGLAWNRQVKVLDSTRFLLQLFVLTSSDGYTQLANMTNVITQGTINVQRGTVGTLQDMIDLATAKNCDIHFNVPLIADRSVGGCVDQVAAYFAAHMPAGMKIRPECANEVWNYGFPNWYTCVAQTNAMNGGVALDYVPAYVANTKAIHDRFRAAFAAAGRGGDVICLWSSLQGNAPLTAIIAAQAQAAGARMDEMCVAAYYGNYPFDCVSEPNQARIYPKMTFDQDLDYFERNVLYGGHDRVVATVKAAVASNGYPDAKVIAYEGSMDTPVPASDADNPLSTPNYWLRYYAARFHPRAFGITACMLGQLELGGMSLMHQFIFTQLYRGHAWGTWDGWNEQAGTGNPAENPDPLALDQVKNQIGGALRTWSSLLKASPILPAKALRNGKKKAKGRFLRGR